MVKIYLDFNSKSCSFNFSGIEDKLSQTASSLPSSTGINNPNKSSVLGKQNDPRSVVGILTRKPSPLKDLALGRTANCNVTANSSGNSILDIVEC